MKTKHQIERLLRQIFKIKGLHGSVSYTFPLPSGPSLQSRLDAFDHILESVEIEGVSRYKHIFSNSDLSVYILSE
jgi:hypothetical protein